MGYQITGRFSPNNYGNSADLDWVNQISPSTRNVVAPDLIELAPSVAISPVEYKLTVNGEGVDPTATATFEIR